MLKVREGRVAIEQQGMQSVAYLEWYSSGIIPPLPLGYLHVVRSTTAQTQPFYQNTARQGYLNSLKRYQQAYREWSQAKWFDTVLRAPSSRCDAAPFADAILSSNPEAVDITDRFAKSASWKSGLNHGLPSARRAISASNFSAASTMSIAIIDDTLNEGKTIAILLELLRKRKLSTTATVWLIVPLVMRDVL